MDSSYTDPAAIVQIIGCLFNNASLLDSYSIQEKDFDNLFHRIIVGAIYNIHLTGSQVNLDAIVDYLSNRPKFEAVFKQNKGEEYILEVSQVAQQETFNYYYNRLKKMSLLRAYDSAGVNVRNLYDPDNILDTKKRQEQETWLDATPLQGITQAIDRRIEDIKLEYLDDSLGFGWQAGDGIDELLEKLKKGPQVGIPMYGALINTVTKGARLRKYYLRSAASGIGKSRCMVADALAFACNKIYHEQFGWINNGACQPTLYIGTEQEKEEIQTMMLAFISNVDEERVADYSKRLPGETERIEGAAKLMKEIPLWCEWLPDFSLKDVENRIKKHIHEHGVKYVMFDYIKTSPKILEELTKRSAGVKLREDNILFMLSSRLKDIANEYGIFVESATQLNGKNE